MPYLRRRPKLRQEPPQGAPRTREHLLTGHDWPTLLDGPDLDEDQLRAEWERLREDLLLEHTSLHPGQRPWGWWRWESPEPRRRVGDGPAAVPGCPLWFGTPSQHRGMPPDNMYEPERDYLQRLRLLLPHE
jgi:hypothetical protein